MLGSIILRVLIGIEIIFYGVCIFKKSSLKKEKACINIGELILFMVLVLNNVIEWTFRWKLLAALLGIRGLLGIYILVKGASGKEYKLGRTIRRGVGSCLLILAALLPVLIFPQYKELQPTGNYKLDTVSYTWTDESREETFETDGSKRDVTVQLWYPETDTNEKFPLIIFSHGSFGYRMSNYSTFTELASHGYVVCSIDHPYHAFYTEQTDGKVITVNPQFMQETIGINTENVSEEYIFNITRQWMNLRCEDINFIIDTIKEKTKADGEVFDKIDINKIGVMGHSLGGAAAVQIGRERKDIDAVIDIDGTMLGEELACKGDSYTYNEEPYPLPLLSIDSATHFEGAQAEGVLYVNNKILANAREAKEIHFNGAGHLNFTDLPYFSPILARFLGTGSINQIYCTKTMDDIILRYYNHYLKDVPELILKDVY